MARYDAGEPLTDRSSVPHTVANRTPEGVVAEIERFIQTLLREWAYAAAYQDSTQRTRALNPWIDYYNHNRPHSALGHKTPASRLTNN